MQIDRYGVSTTASATLTLNLDTWYTFKVLAAAGGYSLWVDGTLVLSGTYFFNEALTHLNLFCFRSVTDFRNIEVWTPTLPT